MTVTTQVSRVEYEGAGTVGPFPVPFYFLAAADLVVMAYSEATDGERALVLGTDYAVAGAGVQSGGAVTLTAGLAVGRRLTIYRDPTLTQDASYVDHARFPAASHEMAMDKGRMIEQRTRDMIVRAPRLRESDIDGVGAYQAGGNRIDDLGAPTSAGSAARLQDILEHVVNEAELRIEQLAAEAKARIDGLGLEADTRSRAIAAETKARSDADTAQTDARTALESALRGLIANTALGQIQDGSLTTPKYGDKSVTSSKIDLKAITTALLALGSVTGPILADGVVDTRHYVPGSVKRGPIPDGGLTSELFAARSVGNGAIALGAISGNLFAAKGIPTEAIGDNAVGTGQMAGLSVTGPKIADGAVGPAKVAANSLTDAQFTGDMPNGLSTYRSTYNNFALNANTPFQRRLQDVVYDRLDARNFGARGDGTGKWISDDYTLAAAQKIWPWVTTTFLTYDYVGIQSAINYARAQGGNTVWLPRGVYRLGGQILSLDGCRGVRIVGSGMDATLIDSQHASNPIFYTTGTNYFNGIEHLTCTSSVVKTGGFLIHLRDERRMYMARVKLTGWKNAVYFQNYENSTMYECVVCTPSAPDGIAIQLGAEGQNGGIANFSLINNFIRGNNPEAFDTPMAAYGVVIFDVDGVYGFNTDIGAFKTHDLLIRPTQRSYNHFFNQCYFDSTSNGHCVQIAGNGQKWQYTFANCWFAGAGRAPGADQTANSGNSDGCGLYIPNQGNNQDWKFTGCYFGGNAGAGVLTESAATDAVFTGCSFLANGQISRTYKHQFHIAPATEQTIGITITGCNLRYTTGPGFDVYAEANARLNVVASCSMQFGIERAGSGRNMAFRRVDAVDDQRSMQYAPVGGSLSTPVNHNIVQIVAGQDFSNIAPTWPGHMITVLLSGGGGMLTGGNMNLNGSFNMSKGNHIALMCWNDGVWREVSRAST